MVTEKFIEFCDRTPFRAFQLFLTDGRALAVNHPDYVALEAATETATIYDEKSDFAEVIDIFAVVALRFEPAD